MHDVMQDAAARLNKFAAACRPQCRLLRSTSYGPHDKQSGAEA